MIRISQTLLLGCCAVAFSLSSVAVANETPSVPTNENKEILCVMPMDAQDSSDKPSVKKLTLEDCLKEGGKPATPHAMPTGPKPKD